MLPTFIGIGAMKAATTTLSRLLDDHPEIAMAPQKEVRFFCHDENWHRGIPWYEAQFESCEGRRAIGEISPAYAYHPVFPDTASRMASALPDVRLVYIVRNPIERVRSHYLNDIRSGRVLHDQIDRAVRQHSRFVDCSRYAMQIGRYLEHYDRSQLVVVTTEALGAEPGPVLEQIYRHVGVDPAFRPVEASIHLNPALLTTRRTRPALRRLRRLPTVRAAVRRLPVSIRDRFAPLTSARQEPDAVAIDEDTRRWLTEQLAPDVAELRSFLPADFDGWGIA